jgi:hypothetical protein
MLDNLLTGGLIQFQIECQPSSNPYQCYTCRQSFKRQDARVIACNAQGQHYGDICAGCISKGSSWLSHRLQQEALQLSS